MKHFFKIILVFIGLVVLLFFGALGWIELNQQKIITRIKAELSKSINGELTIDKVSLTALSEFPNFSLNIIHPVIKDSLHHEEVFSASRVYCRLNILQLLRLKIDARSMVIDEGHLFFKTDSTGYSNSSVFNIHPKNSGSAPDINFELEHLKLDNLKITVDDNALNKHFSFIAVRLMGNISKTDTSFLIPLAGLVHVDSMLFKADKGSFMMNEDADVDLKLNYLPAKAQLDILPSPVVVEQQKCTIWGTFLFTKKPAYMSLHITNPAADFGKARHILSDKIQSKMKGLEVFNPVDVKVYIRGDMSPSLPPLVDAEFKVHSAHASMNGVELTELDMDGLFINHVVAGVKNDDPNSAILFNVRHARVEGVPISAQISVTDLKALYLDVSLSSHCLLTDFNQAIPSEKYRFTAGEVNVSVGYRGTLYYYLDSIKQNHDDTLSGSIKIDSGAFVYDARNLKLENMNAEIGLGIKNLEVKNLSCSLNGNNMALQGNITSLRRIFSADEQKMLGTFTLNAPVFDLTKVLVSRKNIAPVKKPANEKNAKIAAQTIDELTARLTAVLNFKSGLFTYRKFAAKNVAGEVTLSANGLSLKNFKLEACKGSLQLDGGINSASANDKLEMRAKVKNVDVKEFFTMTENFNQDAIVDTNINGRLSADVYFYSPLAATYMPVQDSMKAVLYFSWTDGKLINFQPFVDIGKKVFKKRNFSSVSFAGIHDTLLLEGNKLKFRRMEIASSVMRVFVLGWYNFKGLTDIAIQFPLSNLKKQEIDYQPENIGTDAKVGAAVIVRVHGENNNMKITLDPNAKRRLERDTN